MPTYLGALVKVEAAELHLLRAAGRRAELELQELAADDEDDRGRRAGRIGALKLNLEAVAVEDLRGGNRTRLKAATGAVVIVFVD